MSNTGRNLVSELKKGNLGAIDEISTLGEVDLKIIHHYTHELFSQAIQKKDEELFETILKIPKVQASTGEYCSVRHAVNQGLVGFVEKMRFAKNINPNLPDADGNVPLILAVTGAWGQKKGGDLVRALLALPGIKVNVKGEFGKTALHHCMSKRWFEVAEMLLDAEANPKIEDNSGNSPLFEALQAPDVPSDLFTRMLSFSGELPEEEDTLADSLSREDETPYDYNVTEHQAAGLYGLHIPPAPIQARPIDHNAPPKKRDDDPVNPPPQMPPSPQSAPPQPQSQDPQPLNSPLSQGPPSPQSQTPPPVQQQAPPPQRQTPPPPVQKTTPPPVQKASPPIPPKAQDPLPPQSSPSPVQKQTPPSPPPKQAPPVRDQGSPKSPGVRSVESQSSHIPPQTPIKKDPLPVLPKHQDTPKAKLAPTTEEDFYTTLGVDDRAALEKTLKKSQLLDPPKPGEECLLHRRSVLARIEVITSVLKAKEEALTREDCSRKDRITGEQLWQTAASKEVFPGVFKKLSGQGIMPVAEDLTDINEAGRSVLSLLEEKGQLEQVLKSAAWVAYPMELSRILTQLPPDQKRRYSGLISRTNLLLLQQRMQPSEA